ncbi:3-oxoacyl-ACP reductase FabG [Cecembia calidifontis]|jgi:3-oxoacyl-[acyl-carrier protein] reductase|uniref:3-oxoacyl-[acyl-carrier-protein] reductase n=1 Tax=Cecembia calidifontis TaxID=1187080 RepID=A0A4Q7P605_9BACT|nr:3-oxoacyl-ACP reductase FabG [Cecembia calidifontis]RZS95496.1 3-oxoacyl-[acyl-carrier-protein] reductase [Cecembia calidifontis]
MRLENKVAIITGGANGIGEATVRLFAKEGAKISLWDMSEKGRKLAEELTEKGHQVEFRKLSVADREAVFHAVKGVKEKFGRIDILINNAGITRDRTLAKMSLEDWNVVIDVNQTGVFNCTQAVSEVMKENRYGRIVTAASNVGLRGNFGQTNYVATKSAVIGMTKVWALELGKYGITCNSVAPGFIETEMTNAIPEQVKKQMLPLIPVGFWGEPMDIAYGYLYLATDEARYVNGTCLVIDGGAARE